jgi:YfiH family protein
MGAAPQDVLAYLGPAIGPAAFKVGDEVRAAFVRHDPRADSAFQAHGKNHWLADLYELARQRLKRCGVSHVYGGDECTYHDRERFFSYRRDNDTGRMAALIWLAE